MTSLHIDLKEAAKCVDIIFIIIPPILLASLARLRNSYKIQNGDDIWPNLRRLIVEFMKVLSMKACKKLTTGVPQLVRLLFNNNFVKPRTCPLRNLYHLQIYRKSAEVQDTYDRPRSIPVPGDFDAGKTTSMPSKQKDTGYVSL